MLVVSRKAKERILIGEGPQQVVVEVVRVRGDRVRIGVSAPDDVKVLRGELQREDER